MVKSIIKQVAIKTIITLPLALIVTLFLVWSSEVKVTSEWINSNFSYNCNVILFGLFAFDIFSHFKKK